eukprot:COSAG06_NODE_8403_length_2185_cov_6.829685_2_plen_56_part_00
MEVDPEAAAAAAAIVADEGDITAAGVAAAAAVIRLKLHYDDYVDEYLLRPICKNG